MGILGSPFLHRVAITEQLTKTEWQATRMCCEAILRAKRLQCVRSRMEVFALAGDDEHLRVFVIHKHIVVDFAAKGHKVRHCPLFIVEDLVPLEHIDAITEISLE